MIMTLHFFAPVLTLWPVCDVLHVTSAAFSSSSSTSTHCNAFKQRRIWKRGRRNDHEAGKFSLERTAGTSDIAEVRAGAAREADLRVEDERMHVVVSQLVLGPRVIQ